VTFADLAKNDGLACGRQVKEKDFLAFGKRIKTQLSENHSDMAEFKSVFKSALSA